MARSIKGKGTGASTARSVEQVANDTESKFAKILKTRIRIVSNARGVDLTTEQKLKIYNGGGV